jgi:hypothetical protein
VSFAEDLPENFGFFSDSPQKQRFGEDNSPRDNREDQENDEYHSRSRAGVSQQGYDTNIRL